MDWVELVVELIGALAWPLVAVSIAFGFRAELRDVIRRVTGVKAPGVEINMQKSEDSLDATRASVEPEVAEEAERRAVEERDSEKAEQEDALHDPTGVILRSWQDLSESVFSLRRSTAGRGRPAKDIATVLQQLVEDGLVSPEFKEAMLQLRSVRNEVAHGVAPTVATAQAYALNSDELRRLAEAKLVVSNSQV